MNKIAIVDVASEMPEEIIIAADLIPLRVFGDPEMGYDKANEHVPPTHCVWSRNILERAMRGLGKDVQGVITIHGCDCTNRQFDIWLECVDIDFMYFLNSPLKRDKLAYNFYIQDLKELISQLESYFDVKITNEKLQDSIDLMNKIRKRLRALSEYRNKMILKGSEFHSLVKMVQETDKKIALGILKEKLKEVKNKDPFVPNGLKRILLTGSDIDDSEFIQHLENIGFQVIIDDLGVGTKYFWNDVNSSGDPIEALVEYHLTKPIYSTKVPSHERYYFIKNLAEQYQVDGIINVAQKFCESVLYDHPFMNKNFKEEGIPYLFIEMEYNRESYKQLRTRFEAFAEMI
jgi:benzoyl-CoA reductase/2-hydroxyglutaryl-CoA dehydratase subunit BcrC/BadD/HgdB